MKACLAHDIIKRIEYLGEDAQTATTSACKNMTERFLGTGGAITIDSKSRVGISFTSARMVSIDCFEWRNFNRKAFQAWAYQKHDKMFYGIEKDDHFEQSVVLMQYE